MAKRKTNNLVISNKTEKLKLALDIHASKMGMSFSSWSKMTLIIAMEKEQKLGLDTKGY